MSALVPDPPVVVRSGAVTSPPLVGLPAGLTHRALDLPDAAAVHALIAAEEVAVLGEAEIEPEDVVGDWQRPSHDVPGSTVGVFDGDALVAYAELADPDRVDAAVLPAHQGRGIGTALARWLRERARAAGSTVIGMQTPRDSPADRLMAAQGYRLRWTAWDLVLPAGVTIPDRPLPDGYAVAPAVDDAQRRAAWTVLEDAFLEWSDRERTTFEDFCARTVDRPGAEPWNLRLLTGPDGVAVGATHVVLGGDGADAHVARVAVRSDRRGLGLGQALLVDAFAAGRAHGATRSSLSTDSRTGALGLYTRVGMQVASTWHNRAVDL